MKLQKITTVILSVLITGAAGLSESRGSTDSYQQDRPVQEVSGHDEIERFLREASVVRRGSAVAGAEEAYLATLSDGRTAKTLMVQTLRPYQYLWIESRDSLVYNVAAHKLDRLIGAGIAPCSVLRRLNGQWASVTIWSSDDAREAGRRDDIPRATAFRALVADTRGTFAGGFSATTELMGLDGSIAADEQFLAVLESLNRKQLARELGTLLSGREIRFLLARRDRILAFCRNQERSGRAGAD